jgi:uncharacterized protein involved in exopolysaccharide biosynthesis
MTSEKPESQSSEVIDFANLIKSIFRFKKTIFLSGAIGLFLGVLIAFTTPKEYQSSSYVLLESDSGASQMGQLGAIAGLAGINMGQFQNGKLALTPEIFPDVIQSRDFLGEIAKQDFEFVTKDHQVITLEDYYYEERPSNLVKKTLNFVLSIPAIISSWFEAPIPLPATITNSSEGETKQPNYLNLTSKEIFAIGELKKRIEIEQKNNMIRLNVMMPEPLIAAQVNSLVLEKLIAYVTEYKLSNQQVSLEFIEERVLETEKKFLEAQMKLAAFRDGNQGIVSQRLKSREDQLQFEFNIAYNVYNSLSQEYEQASIQLKKETPVFTMLEKAAIPLGPAKPNKPLILIFSLFLGLFMGIIISVYKILLQKIH